MKATAHDPYPVLPKYQGERGLNLQITEDITYFQKCVRSCIELEAEESQLQNTKSLLAYKRTQFAEFSSKDIPR